MKKRILSLALTFALILVCIPAATANAGYTEVIPPKYGFALPFSEGLAAVWLDGKWGFIDKTGTEIIRLKDYHMISLGYVEDAEASLGFREGLAIVGDRETGKWGFIDKTGAEVIPFIYDYVRDFSEGLAAVMLGDWITGKYGFIDKTGREIVPPKYDGISDFSEGLAAVAVGEIWEGQRWGFVDNTGREIVPPKYDYAHPFSEGLAWVMLDGTYGLIDKTGKEIVPPNYYTAAGYFSEGLAEVWRGINNRGFIDKTGKEIVPLIYDDTGGFSEGLAAVMLDSKLGFIDKTGAEVIPLIYDYNHVGAFSEGLWRVGLGDWGTGIKWGFIDKTGKEIVSPKYDSVEVISEGLALVTLGDWETRKYGFIDQTGKEIVPLKYDWAYSFSEGLAVVNIGGQPYDEGGGVFGGKWGYISINPPTPQATPYPNVGVTLNGVKIPVEVYGIESRTFLKLSDLAAAVGIHASWDGAVRLDTTKTPEPSAPSGPFTATETVAAAHYPNIKVTLDGTEIPVDVYGIDGRTFLSLGDVAAALGLTASWDGATSTAVLTGGN